MGYSATVTACDTFDAWNRACIENGGTQNSYSVHRLISMLAGTFEITNYFYEIGREQPDGAITGTVFRMVDDDRAVKAGTFKIDADGSVVRWPTGFKKSQAYQTLRGGN